MIYLDNAATTFPKPEYVYQTMDYMARNGAVNAGRGSYNIAQKANSIIEETRNLIIDLAGALPTVQVIFSPSITIAMNQIIYGYRWKEKDVIYVSPYEHNAVARTLNYLSKKINVTISELPIDRETYHIDLDRMNYEFAKNHPKAVFCTHVSNVTGYILPIDEIFKESKKYNAINILDSAQSFGLIDIDVKKLNIDILAFTGHKTLYGPFGVGGFINISNLELDEVIVGGTGSDSLNLDMPKKGMGKYESSSPNIIAITGLHAALSELSILDNFAHEKQLTDELIRLLDSIKKVNLYLPQDRESHIGIISLTVDGMLSEDVAMILDEDFDIAVRAGYHCAPYIHKYLRDTNSLGTVRIGLSKFNTMDDVNSIVEALREVCAG